MCLLILDLFIYPWISVLIKILFVDYIKEENYNVLVYDFNFDKTAWTMLSNESVAIQFVKIFRNILLVSHIFFCCI